MSESILDRLDRGPGGARQYIANLIVVGGASRARVAEALAAKYGIPEPTGRSITQWKNRDPELRAMIAELQAAKRDAAPGEDPAALLRPEVNRAQAAADILDMAEQFPAFADLMARAVEREQTAPTTTAWGAPVEPDADADDADGDADSAWADVHAVLAAGEGKSDDEFEADCRQRLATAA